MSDRPLDEQFDTMMEVALNPCGAWQAIQAQAAELTRLRARIEAADKLAELCKLVHGSFGGGLVMTFQESDVELFAAALSAYEGGKG